MAPELCMGVEYDEKVDMWAIGVITYILLSGTVPFDGDDKEAMFKNICSEKLSFVKSANF